MARTRESDWLYLEKYLYVAIFTHHVSINGLIFSAAFRLKPPFCSAYALDLTQVIIAVRELFSHETTFLRTVARF